MAREASLQKVFLLRGSFVLQVFGFRCQYFDYVMWTRLCVRLGFFYLPSDLVR